MINNNWKIFVLLIREIALEKKINNTQIAEKTGLLQSNISRIFSLKYCPSLELVLRISNAVGVNFYFEDGDPNSDLSVCLERAMEEFERHADNLNKN